ncbi:MAG: hypothetical protein IKU23_05525 [Clostridia bacterium]|nr:hypothetical protein [Clostridia bacterium]
MKKLITLLTTLILLLTCILSACSGTQIGSTPDQTSEPNISNESSEPAENSVPNENSSDIIANPEDITNTLWEGEDKNKASNGVYVYDNQALYIFERQREVGASLPFIVKTNENGVALVEFLNGANTTQTINYTNVLYSETENNSVLEFTIKDDVLGEMKFSKENGSFAWKEMVNGEETNRVTITIYEKDITAPYVAEAEWILCGRVYISCEYDYYTDYKCDIIYPNGKTVQKTVVIDETENVISTVTLARHYFEGTKPSFTGGKVSPNGTAYDIYEFYGIGDKYGTGYATFGISVKSFGNGVAEIWHNEEWINVNYNEPVFDYVSPDEKYSTGTIDISGTICEITHKKAEYDGEYLSTYENYIIYYNPNNSLEALSTITLTLSEDGGVQRLEIDTYFEWTSDGDTVTITYPNGVTETETLYRNNYGDYLLYEPQ